jgi:hypothetical protein
MPLRSKVWATYNNPYQQMLAAFCYHNISGPQALSVLQDWEVKLSGHLELSPCKVYYDAILQAYANMNNVLHDYKNNNQQQLHQEGAKVALEI